MAEDTEEGATATEATESGTRESAPQGTARDEKDWQAEAEKWRRLSREQETRAKANAQAAEKLAALEETQKTEAQKISERADAAERRARESELQLARYKVAVTKKLPAELADRLRGDTPEELAADADALLALVKVSATSNGMKADPSQGARQSTATAPDMNSLLRAAAGRT